MPITPNAAKAFIPPAKLVDYLLNDGHPKGGAKARFFVAFGFSREAPDVLGAALLAHIGAHEASVSHVRSVVFYAVNGPLATPDGRAPWVRSVWFMEEGDPRPRLVTAYPMDPP